jgi:hypothetical protein
VLFEEEQPDSRRTHAASERALNMMIRTQLESNGAMIVAYTTQCRTYAFEAHKNRRRLVTLAAEGKSLFANQIGASGSHAFSREL